MFNKASMVSGPAFMRWRQEVRPHAGRQASAGQAQPSRLLPATPAHLFVYQCPTTVSTALPTGPHPPDRQPASPPTPTHTAIHQPAQTRSAPPSPPPCPNLQGDVYGDVGPPVVRGAYKGQAKATGFACAFIVEATDPASYKPTFLLVRSYKMGCE